ncbi:hypothetical protein ACHAWC_003349 [Mediolabrus comicus]
MMACPTKIFVLFIYIVVVVIFEMSDAFNLPSSSTLQPRKTLQPSDVHKSCSYNTLRTTSILSSSTDDKNNELIRSLLNNDATNNDNDPYSQYTHQIAIPLGDASELHSALHAIQTSLVRDCPRLIRACVMTALLRLPLLYVDGSSLGGQNVETILESVVHRSIREVVYEQGTQSNDATSTTTTPSSDTTLVEMAQPILLPFRGLELQGDDNSVLYAVGRNINDKDSKTKQSGYNGEDDEDDGVIIVDDWSNSVSSIPSGWETLEALVHRIQRILESEYDCKTCWPKDEAQGEELDFDDPLVAALKQKQKKWRARVPFVRLPTDFYEELQRDLDEKVSRKLSDEEEELSSVDMGLDGISPLFWYEAWGEDDILPAPGVRMRSVAIYRRMVPGGGESEASFYVPASDALQSWKRGFDDDSNSSNKSMDLPIGDTKLMARERRERAKAMERMGEEERRAEREWEEGKAQWISDLDNESDSDDLTEMDIMQPLDPTSPSNEESLPPYPSDAHFTGVWRIVSSPFGGSSSLEGDGLSSSSDNFIFRVDGQVMGGPILNAEFQHKAAGGSWSFFNAVKKSNSDESSSGPPITQTRLRVRLLVPPEKSQTLVIEGEINRLVSPNADDMSSSSTSDAWRMASGGLLDGMSSKLMPNEDDADTTTTSQRQSSQDALIFCRGEAWLEDTEGGSNRKKLGPIALMKLKTPDRNKLIYTVPASKGGPSDDDDEEE